MRHIIGWLAITGLVLFLSLEARPVHAETVEKVQENQTLLEKAGVSTNLQDQVAVLIQKSILLAEKTGEFVVAETSDVVKQFLLWKFWEHTISAILAILFFIPVLLASVYALVKGFDSQSDLEGIGIFLSFIGFLIAGIIGVAAVCEGFKAVKVSVAPKVYLLEWVADKYKGNNNKQ
jgi:hypothetical protein